MAHKIKKTNKFGCLFIFITSFLLIGFLFFYGDYSICNLLKNDKIIEERKRENEQLNAQVEKLESMKERLEEKDLKMVEKVARENYGMAKKGEKIFRITNKYPKSVRCPTD